MEKIASFRIDHTKLERGLYTSRIDGDVTTYDIRTVKPNTAAVMNNAPVHTTEHLFATFARNSEVADEVIYFGPMGCRTGFYFLVRNVSPEAVIDLTRRAFEFIAAYEGDIPGVSAVECGNYLDHDLDGAKKIARDFLPVLDGYTAAMLDYDFFREGK